eukprot:7699374-Alexandrium_andersonii.AAC.1
MAGLYLLDVYASRRRMRALIVDQERPALLGHCWPKCAYQGCNSAMVPEAGLLLSLLACHGPRWAKTAIDRDV